MPRHERYVWICTNRRPDEDPRGSCAHKGSEELLSALKQACAEAGLRNRVRVSASGCLDQCASGITVAVMPDDVVLGRMTLADVPALVEGLSQPGGVARHPALRDRILG